MERFIKILMYVVIAAGVIAASSFYFSEGFYHKMVAEDGPFENITAAVLLLISVLFSGRFIKTWKTRNKFWIILSLIIILGAFFGFGEEISWGQRIFALESGDFFTQNNLQGETNLHNLEVGGVNLNKLIFSRGLILVFGFYFLLSLILFHRWFFFRRLVDMFGIQIPKFKYTVIMLLCTGIILMVPDLRIWELWETIFVAILLLVFLEPYNEKEKLII